MKALACAMLVIGLGALPAHAQPNPAAEASPKQAIIPLDVPPTFKTAARQLGYTSPEPVRLDSLQLTGFRLIVPPGVGTDTAVRALRKLFPNAMVELDSGFKLSSGDPD